MSILVILAAVSGAALPAPSASLQVDVERLRDNRGVLRVCLTRDRNYFPDCSHDPQSLKQSVPASVTTIRFPGVQPGRYALSILHDENANARFDKAFGVPREGFGFSRNPMVRFRAPKFDEVYIEIGAGFTRRSVRMQYLL
jgi:uncharacterized protein (DUF2141 family)